MDCQAASKTDKCGPGWGLSWLEHWLIHQKVGGSIPSQALYPGGSLIPSQEKADDHCFSLTSMIISLTLTLSLSKINKHMFFKKEKKQINVKKRKLLRLQ